jgi:iron complex transport system ATP-binding protein
MTVVAVFHDLNLAAEYCDRLVLLDRGRLVAVGTPAEVLTTEMIQKVYGAEVVIGRNPVSDAPHIILAANRHSCVAYESATAPMPLPRFH